MPEGNRKLGMFVDLSDEQMEKLRAVFGGQKRGPMAGLVPLIGELLGVERPPTMADERTPSRISAFGIDYERTSGLSTSACSWAA